MKHELDKLYDEWYEVILEVPVLMNQPTEKSTFLVNDVSTVRIVITFYTGEVFKKIPESNLYIIIFWPKRFSLDRLRCSKCDYHKY